VPKNKKNQSGNLILFGSTLTVTFVWRAINCRQTTKRQYLDSSLSVVKMYEQFVLYYHQQLQLENQREGGTCLVTQHSGGGAALDGENSIIIPADKF